MAKKHIKDGVKTLTVIPNLNADKIDNLSTEDFIDGVYVCYYSGLSSGQYTLAARNILDFDATSVNTEDIQGILIVEGNYNLLIGLEQLQCGWSSENISCGGFTTTNISDAIDDLNGKLNTAFQYTHEECQHLDSAVGFCMNFGTEIIPAGLWWLPSYGECMMIHNHISEVNYILRKLGYKEIRGNYWSSTEYNFSGAWRLSMNSNAGGIGGPHFLTKSGEYGDNVISTTPSAVPVTQIASSANFKPKSKGYNNLKIIDTTNPTLPDISFLPDIQTLDKIILRYNGVVKDVDTYMMSTPVTLDELIAQGFIDSDTTAQDLVDMGIIEEAELDIIDADSKDIEIPREKFSDLQDAINEKIIAQNNSIAKANQSGSLKSKGLNDINSSSEVDSLEIKPLANLTDYVKTPNNWLKIYVPESQIYNYRLEYPTLKDYLLPITGYKGKEIGGRNLLLDSHVTTSGTYSLNSNLYYRFSENNFLEDGEVFTLTVKAKLGEGKTHLTAMNSDGNGNYQFGTLKYLGNDLYRLTGKYKQKPESTHMTFYAIPHEVGTTSYVYWAKLERGTVATDWTPAPEDIKSDFKEVYETIEAEKEDIEETYAKKDGAYEGLLAGTAMNLQGQQDVTISSMYQPTGGNLDVNWETAEILNIKGNAVAWNQLVENGDLSKGLEGFGSANGANISKNGNNLIVENSQEERGYASYKIDLIPQHTYLLVVDIYSAENGCFVSFNYEYYYSKRHSAWERVYIITKNSKNYTDRSIILGNDSDVINEVSRFNNIQIFDLTLIYGMGNEPTDSKQFEEDYQRWFGKQLSYEKYDDGSIKTVLASGLKTVGFNLCQVNNFQGNNSSEWNRNVFDFRNNSGYKGKYLIEADIQLPSDTTSVRGFEIKYKFEDERNNLISLPQIKTGHFKFITNENVEYIRPSGDKDINISIKNLCISMYWSGSRNGDYEEYWEETKALPITTLKGKLNGEGESVVVFSDGLKRVGNVYDEIKVEDGVTKAIKRIEKIILSDFSYWNYNTANDLRRFQTDLLKKSISYETIWNNTLTPRLVTNVNPINRYVEGADQGIICNETLIYIRDTRYTDVESFKESIQNVPCYYVLAEPEVYILDDFQLPLVYKIDDFGTEQIISPENTITPILTTRYGVNAVDTLRRLPQNYVSERSINNLLYQLNSVMNGTWNKSWNSTTNSYDFSFIPNEVPDSSIPNEELP